MQTKTGASLHMHIPASLGPVFLGGGGDKHPNEMPFKSSAALNSAQESMKRMVQGKGRPGHAITPMQMYRALV